MAMVRIKCVKKEYQMGKSTVHALRGVDLEINKGEFVTIAGSSGSGKSTLLNLIGCLDVPTDGEIWIDDKQVNGLREKALNHLRRHVMGFIFQSFNLIPVINIYENVELPLLIRKDVSAQERKERVEHFVEAVGLTAKMKHRPNELSGGQQQRVAAARALVTKPQMVLADEPTGNLDSQNGIELIELMHGISRREGTTFIFSTHDPKVMNRADRIIYLEDGMVKSEGGG